MLFMLHCIIEPEHRDENRKRLRDMMIGEPNDIKVLKKRLTAIDAQLDAQ